MFALSCHQKRNLKVAFEDHFSECFSLCTCRWKSCLLGLHSVYSHDNHKDGNGGLNWKICWFCVFTARTFLGCKDLNLILCLTCKVNSFRVLSFLEQWKTIKKVDLFCCLDFNESQIWFSWIHPSYLLLEQTHIIHKISV